MRRVDTLDPVSAEERAIRGLIRERTIAEMASLPSFERLQNYYESVKDTAENGP